MNNTQEAIELFVRAEKEWSGYDCLKVSSKLYHQALAELKKPKEQLVPKGPPAREFTKELKAIISAQRQKYDSARENTIMDKAEETCGYLKQSETNNKRLKEVLRLFRQDEPTAEEENERHKKPCPHNKTVMCVQYPENSCGCDPCEECETKLKANQTLKGGGDGTDTPKNM